MGYFGVVCVNFFHESTFAQCTSLILSNCYSKKKSFLGLSKLDFGVNLKTIESFLGLSKLDFGVALKIML